MLTRLTTLSARRWFETVVISVAGPGLCLLLRSQDPFFLQSREPWLLLLPVLCGAQHGLKHAAASSGILLLLVIAYGGGFAHADPALLWSWGAVSMLAGAIAGHYHDVREEWHQRLTKQVREGQELVERSARAERALKLSHAKLEERFVATRWSLAGVLSHAERHMQRRSTHRELGELVLETLSSQVMVQAAALYWSSAGELQPSALATLGDLPRSAGIHPLVARAWSQRCLQAVGPGNAAKSGEDAGVLVAVPLVTASGALLGVVAIHEMAFIAFQPERLRELVVITSQLADLLNDRMRQLDAACDLGEIMIEIPASADAPLTGARALARQVPARITALYRQGTALSRAGAVRVFPSAKAREPIGVGAARELHDVLAAPKQLTRTDSPSS